MYRKKYPEDLESYQVTQFDLWIFAFFVLTNFSRQLSVAILLRESSSMILSGA